MPTYFAYGSNMDVGVMMQRCPRSKPIGVGRLAAHRFLIFHQGYASVRRERGATVHGLLWDLAFADIPALDRYEEISAELYTKVVQPVLTPGGLRRALMYVGQSAEPGEPRPHYMEALIASAEALQLPPGYLAELRTWLPRRFNDRRFTSTRVS